MPVRCFSACFISALMLSSPPSILLSCSPWVSSISSVLLPALVLFTPGKKWGDTTQHDMNAASHAERHLVQTSMCSVFAALIFCSIKINTTWLLCTECIPRWLPFWIKIRNVFCAEPTDLNGECVSWQRITCTIFGLSDNKYLHSLAFTD